MTATLDEYREQAEQIGSDAFLGRLFWYSLSNVRLPHTKMLRLLHQCGIMTQLPLPPTDVDVFKRVCTSVKRNKIPWNSSEHYANFIMREFRDDAAVTRRIVREIVDSKGKRLSFTEMADVIFRRADASLHYVPIDGSITIPPDPDESPASAMFCEISEQYALWQGCMNPAGVRWWIRGFILNLGATMVREGGGVYFVAEDRVRDLDGLEQLAALITSEDHGQVEFHSLPLLDDGKQRDMVRRAFEAETCDAIDAMLVDVIAIGDEKITTDRYAKMLTEYQQLMSRTKDYEALLENTLATTGTRLQLFQKALLRLRLNVRED